MSSYIAFELDALNKAPSAARAARVTEDIIIGGLTRMWAHCFREKTAALTPLQIAGFFSTDSDTVPALVAFGFLAHEADVLRVKGADRYLRVAEGRSKGGKAAAGNLIPGGRKVAPKPTNQPKQDPDSTLAAAETQPSPSRETCSADPRLTLGLSPTTDDRLPTTDYLNNNDPLPVAAFEIGKPDLEVIDSWPKEDFWRAAEVTRRSMGYPPEKWPNPVSLSRWWGEARCIAEVRDLAAAFSAFAHDKHWRTARPPAPFGAFMSKWSNFLPMKGS